MTHCFPFKKKQRNTIPHHHPKAALISHRKPNPKPAQLRHDQPSWLHGASQDEIHLYLIKQGKEISSRGSRGKKMETAPKVGRMAGLAVRLWGIAEKLSFTLSNGWGWKGP